MKTIRLLILILSTIPHLAAAPPAAQETRVRLFAKTAATTRETDNLWKTDYGSYDRDVYQLRLVTARIECTQGEEAATVVVQWIGRDKSNNSAAVLLHRQEKPLALKSALQASESFHHAFAETDTKYAALGTRDRSGHRYAGWIIRILSADGKVLAEQSSSPPLLKKFAPEAKPTSTE